MIDLKKNFKKYFITMVALGLNILMWLWLIFIVRPTVDNQVLHYNIYFGIDQLGSGIKIYLLPILGLIIIAVNLLLILFKPLHKKLFTYISIMSLLMQVLLVLSAILLIINYY